MRAPRVGVSVAVAACCVAALAAQAPQAPVFRSGIEVLEVDASVVDAQGKPVSDLRAPEFTVSVDDKLRRVVSSEYISDVSAESQLAGITVDPYVSNNTDRRPGRLIVLVIDQNNMAMDRLRGSLDSVRKFIAGLAPNDRVALMAIPAPGPVVEFTTNHQQVQDALNGVVGRGGEAAVSRYNMSDYEALAVADGHDQFASQQLVIRICGPNISPRSTCRNDVEQDALQRAQQVRSRVEETVSALGGLFKTLKDVDGAKSMIMLSQGLMIDDSSGDTRMLADLAAEARISLNVLLFDWNGTTASERRPSTTQSQDNELREAGLSTVAGRARGALFRVATNPQYPFDRISTELAGHYILGVESSPSDRDGKPHHIKVQVSRKATQIRARQQFQYVPFATKNWSRDEVMSRVLSSPSPATQIPMRVTTYAYRDDAQSQKVKLIVAAEFDPSGTGPLDLAIGHAVYDQLGHLVDVGQERKIYSANSDRPLRFDMAVVVDPGTYRFRLAAIDTAGNTGSVEREVQAWRMAGQDMALGDLMLASTRDSQDGSIRPPVMLAVDDGHVQTFTEVYTSKAGSLAGAQAMFEVAEGADTPALKRDPATIRRAPDGLSASLSSNISVSALPPGRYVMRAVVTSAGQTVGKNVRPFLVLANTRPAPATAPAAAGSVSPAAATVAVPSAAGLLGSRQGPFRSDDVLRPDILRVAFDVLEKNHPLAKPALSKARAGQLEGTALVALDAGEQSTGAILRGLELLTKGQMDQAATQFGVALRSAPDLSLASFYLGACYALVGRDREAIANWERARAAQLAMPALPVLIGEAYLRIGQPAQAMAPLGDALGAQPQNDAVRKALAVAQSALGQHAQAYATVEPYLERNATDPDALLVALQAIYQIHADGKTIGPGDQDSVKAATYAKAYAAANGPNQALVEKWVQFVTGVTGAK